METSRGQYGKRNPLFMYQGTMGYSVKATLQTAQDGKETVKVNSVTSSISGTARCGTL